ncbi:MAG: transglycosylase SLT domain-containing protein [Burkholderiales bacterium]|nr:transglycosylase SLT domain-containing protein [Burkholderiales bacterium]
MRLHPTLIVAASALAGACATAPAPHVELIDPPPPVVIAPQPPPLILEFIRPQPPAPFPAAAMADLESLPAPGYDLWERIVEGYEIPDLDGALVEKWEQWYASRPDYVARMVERSRRYLYHIVTEVSERRMPTEIALLPMIESAYNPTALSTARAAGIWQFIPSTGKHYGLTQNFWVDSRRDVVAATDKALEYLRKLHDDFGDWQLALAGYNWGEGNVAKAVARNKAKGLSTNYESLKMPDETRNYLPKLQAVKNIVRDPEKYGLVLADIPDAPYFTVVKTTKKMDTKRAAEIAELSLEDFVALNPQHNRPVIAGADEQSILLPIDNAEIFAAKLELTDQPLVSWQAYRVKANETLPQVATRYGMSVETLRAVNGIGARSRVPVGHTLLVPSQRASEEAEETLTKAVFTTVPAGRTFYYTVRRGDTLNRVAARYGVTSAELKSWNGLHGDTLGAGQRLRVTSDVVPMAKSSGRAKRAVATKGASKAKPTASKPAPKSPPTARVKGQFGG